MNRAKMSLHSRAALNASDTIRNVIGSFADTPFMNETGSDSARRTHERIAASPDAVSLIEQGLTQSYAERVARLQEK